MPTLEARRAPLADSQAVANSTLGFVGRFPPVSSDEPFTPEKSVAADHLLRGDAVFTRILCHDRFITYGRAASNRKAKETNAARRRDAGSAGCINRRSAYCTGDQQRHYRHRHELPAGSDAIERVGAYPLLCRLGSREQNPFPDSRRDRGRISGEVESREVERRRKSGNAPFLWRATSADAYFVAERPAEAAIYRHSFTTNTRADNRQISRALIQNCSHELTDAPFPERKLDI